MIKQIRSLFKTPDLPEFVPARTNESVVTVSKQQPPSSIKKRSFSAGKTSLKTASWLTQDISLNDILESQLAIIRARSRELARNTSTGRRFLTLVKNNVVGADGFKLQSRCGDYVKGKFVLDDLANQTIEEHYKNWCRAEHCDITGQSSFGELTRMLAEVLARDGEILVREIIGTKETPYRYQLQALAVDRLDINKRGTASNGNTIRMGVEFNSAGKPVAYYVLARNPHDGLTANTQVSERVLANEIIHRFVRLEPEQVRGVPWAHAIMTGQNMLNLFEEAAVEAAVVGATNMGFFKPPAPGEPGYAVPEDGMEGAESSLADEVAEDGTLIQDAVGASFRVMPDGWDMVKFDPDYPHAAFDPFVQSRKRDISAGLDVAHHNLSGDLRGVNYSSARIGELGERDNWRATQKFLINIFAQRTTERWLEISLLANALTMPNGSALPATKLEKFKKGLSHTARGWEWVDPLKEVNAAKVATEEGFSTRSKIVASKGGDFEENVLELAYEMAMLEKHGVKLGNQSNVANQPANQAAEDEPLAEDKENE